MYTWYVQVFMYECDSPLSWLSETKIEKRKIPQYWNGCQWFVLEKPIQNDKWEVLYKLDGSGCHKWKWINKFVVF